MTKMRTLLQLSLVLGLAVGTGACSTLADLDPTGLLGGDDSAPASQFPDSGAPQASDAAQGTTPDLAGIPSAPTTSSAAQQQQTVQSLAADGAQVQYSADALRGGTEAAAPPPGAAPPPSAAPAAQPPSAVADNEAPPSAEEAPPTAEQAPPSAVAEAAPGTVPPAAPVAPPQTSSAATAAVAASEAPPSAEPPASSLPDGAEPAVPRNTPVRGAAVAMADSGVSDAQLGFKPSSAPPLDPSISQWVAAPIVAHYQRTASNAGIAAAQPAVPQKGARAGIGGPAMSGAVVANMEAIPSGPASVAAVDGIMPTAVIYFPGDGTALSAAARSQIRGAVAAFKAAGGTGTVRVVGHASSRTANMPMEKHLEVIFDKSQKRANAVAQELIHEGVPADKVLVEAVGDSQPVYYESMPKGEEGNRRADIFVQS